MSRWPESKKNADGKYALTWRIIDYVLPDDVQEPLTAAAFDLWAKDTGMFAFIRAAPAVDADITITREPPQYFTNPSAYAIRSGVPGSGLPPTTHFNDGRAWTSDLYRRVVAHEIGHALGIDDESYTPGDLMYYAQAPNSPTEPQSNDVNRLRACYGLSSLGVPIMTLPAPPPPLQFAGSTWTLGPGSGDGGWDVMCDGTYANGRCVALQIDSGLLKCRNTYGDWFVWNGSRGAAASWALTSAPVVPPTPPPVASGPPALTVTMPWQGQRYVGEVKEWRVS